MMISNNTVEIYCDETKIRDMEIASIIWGSSGACRLYEQEIDYIVENDKKNLGQSFRYFHASNLNCRNWRRITPSYIKVIKKLIEFIGQAKLNLLIYFELQNSESPVVFLEKEFVRARTGINNKSIQLKIQSINDRDFKVFAKSARHIKNFIMNCNQLNIHSESVYCPETTGSIDRYRDRSISIINPSHPGINGKIPFYELISFFINEFSSSYYSEMKKRGEADGEYFPTRYEPKEKEDSRLLQCADILCNFSYSLIRYSLGVKDKLCRQKALSLLGFESIRKNKQYFKNNFFLDELKICSDKPEHRFMIRGSNT